ncbi:MAG: helix-turn-helix domain-containing protein [Pseudohongiellaceae bacterium]
MPSVGPLLSEYRKRNRLSQLELSLMADVSSRHISFIETGRTKPSRDMILRLADVMDLPHRDSNLLLSSGGYVPAYTDLNLDSSEMAPIRQALSMILDNHDPFPALVMDGNWNLLMQNQTQSRLMAQVLGPSKQLPTNNVLEAVFLEDGFKPYIVNWEEVASHLLRRLRKQVLAFDHPDLKALYTRIMQLSPPEGWQQPEEALADGPVLTIDFDVQGVELSMFTTLTQFGTALDTGTEELLIESYFPADDKCRELFAKFLN